jgi:hypothetical protein
MDSRLNNLLRAVPLLLLFGAHRTDLQITVPARQFKVLERIPAEIENSPSEPITFCVEFGQTSPSPDENGVEATPSPFVVQAYSSGKWHTLLIGPDVGSSRHSVVLEAKKSAQFPFRLRQTGQIRLVLWYWVGAVPNLDCTHPPKGEKKIESKAFIVE